MALSLNSDHQFQTAPVGIALMSDYSGTPYGTVFAASIVALIPIIVLLFGARKWLVGGAITGAVKG